MNPQPTEQQTKEILKRLEELHKKATPGEWEDLNDSGLYSGAIASRGGAWLLQSWGKTEEDFQNADNNRAWVIALHNAFPLLLSLSSRTLAAEAELQKAQRESEEALQHAKAMAENAALWSELLDDAKATITSLRSTVARMEGALDGVVGMLRWAADPGVKPSDNQRMVWRNKAEQLEALQPAQSAQSTPPLTPTAMDWDDRLPYVPEKKTEGLPEQGAAKAEERPACENCGNPATCTGRYEGHGMERLACDDCCGHGNEDGYCRPLASTPPQEQKTGDATCAMCGTCNELVMSEPTPGVCANCLGAKLAADIIAKNGGAPTQSPQPKEGQSHE